MHADAITLGMETIYSFGDWVEGEVESSRGMFLAGGGGGKSQKEGCSPNRVVGGVNIWGGWDGPVVGREAAGRASLGLTCILHK